MTSNNIVKKIIQYIRENYDKIFSMEPEDVVQQIMDAIMEYGEIGRLFIKSNWSIISQYLLNPLKILNEVKNIDPELYTMLIKKSRWLNKFFKKMYMDLKEYIG